MSLYWKSVCRPPAGADSFAGDEQAPEIKRVAFSRMRVINEPFGSFLSFNLGNIGQNTPYYLINLTLPWKSNMAVVN